MTPKELISKFCLINNLLYREVIRKFKFFDNCIQIINNRETIKKLSMDKDIRIEVVEG